MLKPYVLCAICAVLTTTGCRRSDETNGSAARIGEPSIATSVNTETEASAADSSTQENPRRNYGDPYQQPDPLRISNYVRRIFQDRRGHLWFGTNGDGVCRFDGKSLEYFSLGEGFGGVAVRGIIEDRDGNVWFGTEGGLTKYDGKSFTRLTQKNGLIHNDVWSLMMDRDGLIWIGTLYGVSRFDGEKFTQFELPKTAPDPTRGVTSDSIVHCIRQDSKGRMWFASNGGAYVWDGDSLENLSEDDGLCHNSVNCILQASDGAFWFATHHNGVCRFDGKTFRHFGKGDGVTGTEAWDLYEDKAGNIWFTIEHGGVYRFDGKTVTRFHRKQGLECDAVQCTFEDEQGRLWFGGVFGLFRLNNGKVMAVSKNGPWQ